MITERLTADAPGLARAAALLREGRLVAFPTETVYGLGGDAGNDLAVAGIFAAKGRPHFNPLIAHVPDLAAARRIAVIEGAALKLAELFWPGPLTLVLPVRPAPSGAPALSPLVSAGLDTVAVRIPGHAITRELLRLTGRPVAGPSANPSGRVSPTTADHVLAGLGGRIAAVLDAGPCTVGLESTIIGFAPDTGAPLLLRPGGLAAETIEAALGEPLGMGHSELAEGADVAQTAGAGEPLRPSAPGQLRSHYAPEAPLRLDALEALPGETLIGFGPVAGDVSLSESGDLVEAAARLFGLLRRLDGPGVRLAVAPIPGHGLGRAIRDRLSRAAAPRDGGASAP